MEKNETLSACVTLESRRLVEIVGWHWEAENGKQENQMNKKYYTRKKVL